MERSEQANSGSSDPPRLTDQMQARTKEAHSAADKAINLRLAGALTDRQRWAQCLATFYVVFERLEGLLSKHKDHPVAESARACSYFLS